ncbi:MAG: carbohydrate-binding domain-containing protein, partial [Clostridia bacterium]|nr:carbohydrate-binding domain-containing protein [Clostridia bacterium]
MKINPDNRKKRLGATAAVLGLCLILTGCTAHKTTNETTSAQSQTAAETGAVIDDLDTADVSGMDFAVSDNDADATYSEAGATVISLSGNGATVDGNGATVSNSVLTISKEGTYILSGSANDLQITVDADGANVKLVLKGATVANSNGPALYVKAADNVRITLADGTENVLSDGSSYSLTDGDTEIDAAVFSKDDLAINGSGSLTVTGNYKHGIVGKDDVAIASGNVTVTAAKAGIVGKDSVRIAGGTLTVTAGSDGIRADNDEDPDKGYITVGEATLTITAGNDGLQAETVLKLDGADVTVTAGGGASNTNRSSDESYKGLKAGSDLYINGGTYVLNTADDAIHSNGTVSITGGTFTVASGDDAVHADTDLGISGGTMNVSTCYEGLEGSKIVIAGGQITLTASDDGLNAAGGNDSSQQGGFFGGDPFSSSGGSIEITGGYLYLTVEGDGVDSNGSVTQSGGTVLVSGPTNSGNGSLDYNGTYALTGGTLVALGSNGMAMNVSSAENQASFLTSVSGSAGESFAVLDANGNVVVAMTPTKAYQTAVVSAAGIQTGETYT